MSYDSFFVVTSFCTPNSNNNYYYCARIIGFGGKMLAMINFFRANPRTGECEMSTDQS